MRNVTVFMSLLQYEDYMSGKEARGATAADPRVPSRAMQVQVPSEDILEIELGLENAVGYLITIKRVDL